jgi:hypothetical protein
MMPSWNAVKITLGAILLALAAACATAPAPPPPPSESLLTAAGFKAVAAATTLQQQHLRALPPGALTAVQQTGKHYYVYPDVTNNRLYVGTLKEYDAYLALRTKNGLPNPTPSNMSAEDMRSYLKQDAAMMKADAQDATIPWWAYWPEFGGLGWVPQ